MKQRQESFPEDVRAGPEDTFYLTFRFTTILTVSQKVLVLPEISKTYLKQ